MGRPSIVLALSVVFFTSCTTSDQDSQNLLTREQLLDPQTCQSCHPSHYKEWSGSMHAYAADDPVFLAMNRRGQEETDGELGDFCVQCHAPMALREGATFDGLNLPDVPQSLKGVTCYFCHSVDGVQGTHNNPLTLADDEVLRGAVTNGVDNGAHKQAYSSLHDRQSQDSSTLCGTCHDIVMPSGLVLETTYIEWQRSFFSRPQNEGGLSCGNCHMPSFRDRIAEFATAPVRQRHDHSMPGVDSALIDWPEIAAQKQAISRELEPSLLAKLCYNPSNGGSIEVTLENIGGGHSLPSGAAIDRRMWVELTATLGDRVLFQTGKIADDTPVQSIAKTDDLLWQIRDHARGVNGDEAHMFWDIDQVDRGTLPPLVTNDPSRPDFVHSETREFPLSQRPDAMEMVVHIRPIGLDILDDLIESGHLAPSLRAKMQTIDIESTRLTWTSETAGTDLCVSPNG